MKEDVKFFTNTEPANFCGWIEWGSSLDNIPFHGVGDTVSDEFSDILTECGSCVGLIQSVDVRIMLVVPGLHWVVSDTSVSLPMASVSPGDSCSIHQVVHHAACHSLDGG